MKKHLCLMMLVLATNVWGADAKSAAAAATPAATENPELLRFTIQRFVVEGAKLIPSADFDKVVAPYVGRSKDFSDVQHALEAVEELYAKRGYSAVHVLLPEQELEAGIVRFEVVESRFGKVIVKDNQFVSNANVLTALPSVRAGGVPQARQISRELRLANENPARQLNVVMKAADKDDEVDASVLVTDSKPGLWAVNLDNTGTPETGRARIGVSYRHANLFDRDQVGQVQMQFSPEFFDRVRVIGGGYKIPLYQYGHSIDVFGGYSNINSVVGGLTNFQGGGQILSGRYNVPLERSGSFDPRVSFGLDWRKFSKVQLTNPPPITLYNDIVATPLSIAYTSQGKAAKGDVSFNLAYAMNVPLSSQGKSADFANYDQISFTKPTVNYKVLRYGAGYSANLPREWALRAALNGQMSGDQLIQGEQIRLGGADSVRGFSEGSEGGESGMKVNLEGYTPALDKGDLDTRGVMFFDWGTAKPKDGFVTAISGLGVGLRSSYAEHYSLRMDAARIVKAGSDPLQKAGNWRLHASLVATF